MNGSCWFHSMNVLEHMKLKNDCGSKFYVMCFTPSPQMRKRSSLKRGQSMSESVKAGSGKGLGLLTVGCGGGSRVALGKGLPHQPGATSQALSTTKGLGKRMWPLQILTTGQSPLWPPGLGIPGFEDNNIDTSCASAPGRNN